MVSIFDAVAEGDLDRVISILGKGDVDKEVTDDDGNMRIRKLLMTMATWLS